MFYENDNLLYLFFIFFVVTFFSSLLCLHVETTTVLFIHFFVKLIRCSFLSFFYTLKIVNLKKNTIISLLSLSVWNSGQTLNCWSSEIFTIWIKELTMPITFAHSVNCTSEKWLIPFKTHFKSFLTSA
jgi:hypothetical protein